MTKKLSRLEISNLAHDFDSFAYTGSNSAARMNRKRTRLEISNPTTQNFNFVLFNQWVCWSCYRAWLEIMWALPAQVRTFQSVGVLELLSGMTRNYVGFARAGSNPATHD